MKIKRFENNGIVQYDFNTIEELKTQIEKWKEDFRKSNMTDEIIKKMGKDRSYDRYCEELDSLIEKFKV